MDRFELCRALRSAGVPEAYYEIQDCPHGPHMTDRYFLEERGGLWAVGVHERGTREVWERFTDEDQACRWLHDRLTGEGPPPEPPTPEEMDQLLRDGEGIQRRAREALDQALTEARGRTTEEPRPDDGRTQPPPAG
ncbi:hypothetical protein [Streptomyces sp. RP5T]|uniref:hypothetical protein n=1 Tax=Streptomyces sp. RP5T TaxID=2490848 RepID=UPI000F64C084|nr:hypothetical protein [Streptomyces sp. RP5T]RRR78232.1 hypothetical protein EHS43_26645 [Streptomyces sp. RP5T]